MAFASSRTGWGIHTRAPSCSCTAAGRLAAPGPAPPPPWRSVAGKRSPSTSAGTVNPTGRVTATTASSRSPKTSARYCATCLRTPSWWAHPSAASPRCSSLGELAPGIASAVVLVDIVPDMNPSGAARIHDFMADRMVEGFDSLDEVADMIAEYNPHRPRPTDLNGLRANLRRRGDRWYWHWDPQFIDGTAANPPIEVTDPDRMHKAVEAILADEVPMLLVRGQVSDLVSQDRAEEFLARFPQVEFVDVQGAGHMVAGDRNDLFAEAVVDFLNRHADAR